MSPATIVPSRSQPDGNAELRNAVQEIGGAVERIDDPGVRLVGAFAAAAFLADEAVARTRLVEFRVERLLGAAVGGGDEIRRAFERNLQLLDFAEIALERAARFARGGDHHVEQCGVGHGACGLPAGSRGVKAGRKRCNTLRSFRERGNPAGAFSAARQRWVPAFPGTNGKR